MYNPLDFTGRRILVTGAASGIGRATAILLSRLAARVIGVDADAAGLQDTVSSLEGSGHEGISFDLRDLASISNWMTELSAKSGLLSGMVHAAGIPCVSPLRLLKPETYRDVLTVNTEAALALARAFQNRKVCAEEGGSIVLIASVMALVGSPGAIAYSLSKAALIGMTRSMAIELACRKIRVNCVAPGFVHTPMYLKVAKLWDADQAANIERLHPLGLGEPEDIANAIAFLLADTGKWITGIVLTIDGGYTAQ
jgi:NAD(P)-dependent dehydrogenase (short-subunit alcohol dehydrogenase family)